MDLVLHDLFLCTGEPDGFFPQGAILIRDGQVLYAGAATGLDLEAALPGAERRSLGGQVVIPGLINTHAHGGLSLHRGCCDDGDLFQWAGQLAPHTGALTLEENREGCELAVLEMVRNGITTACDCTRYGAGIFADVASRVGMRSLSGALANSTELRPNGRPNWPLALSETQEAMARHRGNGLCRFYLGAHSPYSATEDLVREVSTKARALDLPFVIHLAENRREGVDLKARTGLSPMQWLQSLGALGPGAILAHCVWLDESDLALLAASGAGVAHNPGSNAKLASGVAPILRMRELGVPVGLGTDSTLSNNALDLFQEMRLSVFLQRIATLDGNAMSAVEAFAMATRDGAQVLGWHDQIGTLTPGKAADLVVLDMDHPLGLTPERVLSDLVYHIGPREVREVMVAGRTIYRDGQFTQVDAAALKAAIRNRRNHITKEKLND